MFRSLASSVVRVPKPFALKQGQFIAPSAFQTRNYAVSSSGDNKPTIAVLLHGSGYLDGTEITEAVSTLIHLSRSGYRTMCFAPDGNQEETFDHATKAVEKNEIRNLVAESSRITRVPVRKLNTLKADAFSALIIPGGMGVAKNLSNFSEDPSNFKIEADTERVIKDFLDAKKPIGAICIAPILIAKTLKNLDRDGAQITVGKEDRQAIDTVNACGSEAVELDVDGVHVDESNLIVSTPAYMARGPLPHHIFDAVGALVEEVCRLAAKSSVSGGEDAEDLSILEDLGATVYGKEKWIDMRVNNYTPDTVNNEKHAKPSGYADESLADFKTIKRVQT